MFLVASNACRNRNCTLLKWCVKSQSLKAGLLISDTVRMTGEADLLSSKFFWKNIYLSRLFKEKHILSIPMIQGKTVLFFKNLGKNIPKNVYKPCTKPWDLNCIVTKPKPYTVVPLISATPLTTQVLITVSLINTEPQYTALIRNLTIYLTLAKLICIWKLEETYNLEYLILSQW